MLFGLEVFKQKSLLILIKIGNKKAKTKSRLLNESVSTAVIDEKF